MREKNQAFVAQVQPLIEEEGPQNVFKADQSGINKEMWSGMQSKLSSLEVQYLDIQRFLMF